MEGVARARAQRLEQREGEGCETEARGGGGGGRERHRHGADGGLDWKKAERMRVRGPLWIREWVLEVYSGSCTTPRVHLNTQIYAKRKSKCKIGLLIYRMTRPG